MGAYDSIEGLNITVDGPVLRLELDQTKKRNSINDDMVAGLIDAIQTAGRDEAVRVIVLRGAGDHFCAGFDIVSRNAGVGDTRPRVGSIQRRLPAQAHRLIEVLLTVQTPVVCRVQGWAAGIGFHMALAADFTVAASDARFWEPFMARGFTPDSGGTWMLTRRVGPVRARQLILLGEPVNGTAAAAERLIHQSVSVDELDGAVEALVGQLAEAPTVTVGLAKWLMHAGETASLTEHLQNEALAMELSSRSEDFREGLTAFREKRDPQFKGR
jgi:2-(1,2-epoxy-1,2-dihydrophenyl)acetyl-CoA isomerase